MKLDLCCGRKKEAGYQGVDIYPFECVDVVADLRESWPFQDDSVEEILCRDGVEHLPNIIHTMNEIYRVLKPGGEAKIAVPSTSGMGAFQDPTHVSFWNLHTFQYFTKGPLKEQYPSMIKAEFELVQCVEVLQTGNVPYVHAMLRKPNGHSQ